MSDVVLDLLSALNKQAISKIKLVTLKNRRGDAEGEPVTHSEIFDAKFKNYMGRHDQQMHTTLFNLANPSQGRRDVARGGEVRELAASTAPTRTLTAMSAAESRMSAAESNFDFLLNTEAKIERNIKLNQFIIGYERVFWSERATNPIQI